MLNVHVRPVRDLRNNYAEIARIVKEHDPVVITNNGRGESVLINIDDYADYEDYLHRRYILEKLKEAEEAAARPDAVWLSEDEFRKKIERFL